jgi:hypothetical protein
VGSASATHAASSSRRATARKPWPRQSTRSQLGPAAATSTSTLYRALRFDDAFPSPGRRFPSAATLATCVSAYSAPAFRNSAIALNSRSSAHQTRRRARNRTVRLIELGCSLRNGRDEHLAPIVRIRRTPHQTARLQPIDQRGSRLLWSDIAISFPLPDLAIIHSRGAVLKRSQQQPSRSRRSVQTIVAVRRDGHWTLEAFHNTRDRPFAQTLLGKLLKA